MGDEWRIAKAFDVPPWVVGITPKLRFARLRWALRRWWRLPGTGGPTDG